MKQRSIIKWFALKKINRKKIKQLLKQGVFFALAIGCVVFLTKIQTHRVNGISMLPSLQDKDYLLIVKGKKPSRYSIITFQPKEQSQDSFVKRVVGVPGDRIWLDKNTVYLNHQMDSANPTPENELTLSGVDLPDGTLKIRVNWDIAAKLQGLSMIPKDQFFVLGDNRGSSVDSRQLGLIHSKQIEGVVSVRYFPFHSLGPVD